MLVSINKCLWSMTCSPPTNSKWKLSVSSRLFDFNTSRILSSLAHPAQHFILTCSFFSSCRVTSLTKSSCKGQLWTYMYGKQVDHQIVIYVYCGFSWEYGFSGTEKWWNRIWHISKERMHDHQKLIVSNTPTRVLVEASFLKHLLQGCPAGAAFLPLLMDGLWNLQVPGMTYCWLVCFYKIGRCKNQQKST